jgi:hypothetical protein
MLSPHLPTRLFRAMLCGFLLLAFNTCEAEAEAEVAASSSSSSGKISALAFYNFDSCIREPIAALYALSAKKCDVTGCVGDDYTSMNGSCVTDANEHAKQTFVDADYVLWEIFSGGKCKTLTSGIALVADGQCKVVNGSDQSQLAHTYENGSMRISRYMSNNCKNGSETVTQLFDKAELEAGKCIMGLYKVTLGRGVSASLGISAAALSTSALMVAFVSAFVAFVY